MGVTLSSVADAQIGHRASRENRFQQLLHGARKWKTFSVGVALIAMFVFAAIFAAQIAPYDPAKPNFKALKESPSLDHLFGTDDKGRDIFSRVIYGTRISFAIAIASVSLATLIGLPLGLISGYSGGLADSVISRFVDALFAFPPILMAIAIMSIHGKGEGSAIIAIGLIAIPEFARVSRSAMIAEKENDYVLAARAIGCTPTRIVAKGILRNILGPVLVLISLGFAFAILNETALSFLGLGAQPPTASWGADFSAGRRYIREAPWLSIFPGLAIVSLCWR